MDKNQAYICNLDIENIFYNTKVLKLNKLL